MNRSTMFGPTFISRRHGMTLPELMVTLVVAAILLALAVPSMRELIARKRVEGVANELANDLRYLRSVSAQRNEIVQIGFKSNSSVTCYVLNTAGNGAGACDCTRSAQPICTAIPGSSEELKSVVLPRSNGVTIIPDATNTGTMSLQGASGLPSGGNLIQVTVRSDLGGMVRVFTDGVARPTVCSILGHEPNLRACQ